MTLQEFFVWIASGGGSVALLSWIAERIPQFQKLTANMKMLVMALGSVLLAVLAKLAIDFVPAETINALAPYFGVVYGVVLIFLQNQAAHLLDKGKS